MKILIMGLSGSGKTTLAKALAYQLGAVHFNADDIRNNINKDLGFSLTDRLEQAKRLGHLCDIVNKSGHIAIADFICPTHETREAFNPSFVVWLDRIAESNYPDTDKLFEKPDADVIITPDQSLITALAVVLKAIEDIKY
jgi:nucleoside-triphosphatase THEP1